MAGPLISVAELSHELSGEDAPRVLDVRWRLDRPEGRPDYLAAHVPGAVYVDLEAELAERGDPSAGRHPLPTVARVQAATRRWGLHADLPIVIVDDLDGIAAARAWWVLTRSGVPDVRVLDGGLRAWRAAGHAVEAGDTTPDHRGDIIVEPISGSLDAEAAARIAAEGVLIDVRHRTLYRGEDDPHDPVAGHIPGARNLPTTVHVSETGFRTPDELRARFDLVEATAGREIGAYCGSGIASAHTVLAGAIAGRDVRLYAGSWSEWARTRGRHYSVGPAPRGELLPI